MNLTPEAGEFLIKAARNAVENFLENKQAPEIINCPEILREKRGVFVTLKTHPGGQLRGCIGAPHPSDELIRSTIESAVSSAARDPRFNPVKRAELDSLVFEVTVLTKPELIKVSKPEDYPKKIKIKKDGLIIELGHSAGLLLPQVPVEWDWNEKEFLGHICAKAGLAQDAWLKEPIKLSKFQGQIFAEKEPKGEIIEEG